MMHNNCYLANAVVERMMTTSVGLWMCRSYLRCRIIVVLKLHLLTRVCLHQQFGEFEFRDGRLTDHNNFFINVLSKWKITLILCPNFFKESAFISRENG